MKLVRQKHAMGCAPAALAMLSNKSYDEVVGDFQIDFSDRGLHIHQVDAWLMQNGFAVARMLRFKDYNVEQSPWPPAPWADVHLCEVRITQNGMGHWCVMISDGSVLDPYIEGQRVLGDYPYVSNVAAVYKVLAPGRVREGD